MLITNQYQACPIQTSDAFKDDNFFQIFFHTLIKSIFYVVFIQVAIEGMMQTLRSLLLAIFVFKWPRQAVLLYGISHLCGSVMYTVSYYVFFAYSMHRKKGSEKLPVKSFYQLFPSWERGMWMVS